MRATLRLFAAVPLWASCTAVTSFEEKAAWPTPHYGMVVSEHPLATQAGVHILERGGNAADAAVAAALVLAVVHPQAGNLGGGGFALWVPHEGPAVVFDFREEAPAGVRPELYLDAAGALVPERSLATPLAVAVPGSPSGLYNLHARFGSDLLNFGQLCSQAIALAEKGFQVGPWLARDLASGSARERLEADPSARATFYPDGIPLREDQTLVQRDLARTLRLFARRGPSVFYRGEVGRAILATLAEADRRLGGVAGPGLMTAEDLEGYRVVEREPLVGWFRGAEVLSAPPPSSGGVVLLQILAILEGLPLDAERRATLATREFGLDSGTGPEALSARAVHWWIEAMRRAFADRAMHLGDPDHYDVPVARLLAPDWIAERRVSIGTRADPGVAAWAPAPPRESPETTHLSVIDRYGNAVSLTTTLNASFGSGILVAGAGFLLNNEIDDFSIQAGTPNLYGLVGGAANQLGPKKRPLSSMTPTVVREGGGVSMVLGAPGGPRIITAVAQVMLRVLAYGQDLETAVRAPRLHQQWRPTGTLFERGWDPALLEVLASSHGQEARVEEDERFASVQAIHVGSDLEPVGASDPRRGGTVGAEGRHMSTPTHPNDPVQPVLRDAAQ